MIRAGGLTEAVHYAIRPKAKAASVSPSERKPLFRLRR
jgi:hypothetical protein